MVFQTEKAMEEVGDKLDPNDRSEVEADLAALKELVEKTNNTDNIDDAQVDALKSGKEKLMNSAQKLFAKVYEQSQAAGSAAGSADAGAGSAADDVVDGDYKEV